MLGQLFAKFMGILCLYTMSVRAHLRIKVCDPDVLVSSKIKPPKQVLKIIVPLSSNSFESDIV